MRSSDSDFPTQDLIAFDVVTHEVADTAMAMSAATNLAFDARLLRVLIREIDISNSIRNRINSPDLYPIRVVATSTGAPWALAEIGMRNATARTSLRIGVPPVRKCSPQRDSNPLARKRKGPK